jgi:F-type H+-transporting ATPase subunit delta
MNKKPEVRAGFSSRVSRAYARAFVHEKVNIDKVSRMAAELKAINDAFESSHDIRHFFISPITPLHIKKEVFGKISDKFGLTEYTRDLMELIIRNDRIPYLPDITYEFQCLADTLYCRIRVMLITARKLDEDRLAKIKENVSLFFHNDIEMENMIDSSIIDGFIIQTEDKLVDMSVRGQLEKLLGRIE